MSKQRTIQCSYCPGNATYDVEEYRPDAYSLASTDGWDFTYLAISCPSCKKHQEENPPTYIDNDSFDVYVKEIKGRHFWAIDDEPGVGTEQEIPKYLYDAMIQYAADQTGDDK